MTTPQLLQETVGVAALLYAAAIVLVVMTAIASPHPDQRNTAIKVLALLLHTDEPQDE